MLVLHAALFTALLAQRHRMPPRNEGTSLEPVQWLLPLAAPPVKPPIRPPVPDVVRPAVPTPRAAARQAQPVTRPATVATRAEPAQAPPAAAPSTAPTAPDPFDLSATPSPPAGDALLRRREWGAGKADNELRGGKLAKLVRPTDTLQAGLERAFYEAGEAVPPKWFSAPEIREISVPDSRTRMYKIRTMMGTYCFYKPDPSLQAGYDYKLMTCPREK